MTVEAHGGKIGVESDLNNGTTFWFTLHSAENIRSENQRIENTSYAQNSTLTLSADDKKMLEPFVGQFKKHEIYEISMLRKLLKQIKELENENIKRWKEEMSKAIGSGNEELYIELITTVDGNSEIFHKNERDTNGIQNLY